MHFTNNIAIGISSLAYSKTSIEAQDQRKLEMFIILSNPRKRQVFEILKFDI